MGMHQAWSGSISFGLVTIPIKLYNSTDEREYSFNQLCENGHRIQYKRWCPVEEKEVSYEKIKKGHKIGRDNYVVIDKSDIEKLKLKTTKSIEIKEFVDFGELDPILIDKSYYVAPAAKKGVGKPYLLLVRVLAETDRVAVGKIILKDREDIVALRPYQKGLVMHVLKYLDEIRPPDEIPEMMEVTREKIKFEPEEMELAKELVEKFSSKRLDLGEYSDTYSKELRRLIEAKSKGKPLVIKSEPKDKHRPPDLLEALKASIQIKMAKRT
jgi:DNA end-binding protein Ku